MLKRFLLAGFIGLSLLPHAALACACGCGVFDVGTSTMMPTDVGGTVWVEHNFMAQNQNWNGTDSAPKANNSDKLILTNFITVGGEYMFNRSWGVEGELPYWSRQFKTTADNGSIVTNDHSALGDIQLKGVYSGFSDDMSTGVTFGFKLPSGDYHYAGFDRDTEIGTGSTDVLLGGYHMGVLLHDRPLNWFTDGQWRHAITSIGQYRPGDEVDGAVGVYYSFSGILGAGKLSPTLQTIASKRWSDSGVNADPADSGYTRMLIAPGLEFDTGAVKLYGDIEVPFYQQVRGNQLVAPVLTKFMVGYNF